jgi:hypothetical protein
VVELKSHAGDARCNAVARRLSVMVLMPASISQTAGLKGWAAVALLPSFAARRLPRKVRQDDSERYTDGKNVDHE